MVGLDLSREEICKEKFKLWFDAGGWTVQDVTQPDIKKFQIPATAPFPSYSSTVSQVSTQCNFSALKHVKPKGHEFSSAIAQD